MAIEFLDQVAGRRVIPMTSTDMRLLDAFARMNGHRRPVSYSSPDSVTLAVNLRKLDERVEVMRLFLDENDIEHVEYAPAPGVVLYTFPRPDEATMFSLRFR